MKRIKTFIRLTATLIFLFSFISFGSAQTDTKTQQTKTKSTTTGTKSTQTKTKSTTSVSKTGQTKSKTTQTGVKSTPAKTKTVQNNVKTEPEKKTREEGTVEIGTQIWAAANLTVSTFRNGDSIPQAKTNKEWEAAGSSGKPAWCYYNNDPKIGLKYGKLYNWYAVNDPRGLAPEGWILPEDADWAKLAFSLGGSGAAGGKMKSITGWGEGNNGTNDSGFNGYPGGYRVENGTFLNIGNIGIWWSNTENKTQTAIDHYLLLSGNLDRSTSPKQRGESVRCLRNR